MADFPFHMKYFSIPTHISVRGPNHKLYKKKTEDTIFYFAPCITIIYTSTYAHKPHLDLKWHALGLLDTPSISGAGQTTQRSSKEQTLLPFR
jgi:hypothetical protein